jgi:hypothetical protein
LDDYAAEGKIISAYVVNHAQDLARLVDDVDVTRAKAFSADDIVEFALYWMVSIKSVDGVQSIINNEGMLNLLSEGDFNFFIGLCIQEDNVDIFKVFMENPHSFERVKKHSKSLWNSVFPRILNYNMNLAGRKFGHKSQLSSYILSSPAIMETMDSRLVTAIFYAGLTSFESLDLISGNEEAMKKVITTQSQFSRRIAQYLRRTDVSEAAVRLWLTRPSLSLFLSPQTVGYIFVDSAKKNWIDIFEIILDRDELMSKIDTDLLNKGIEINTDEHLEVIAGRLIGSSLLLGKLTNKSVGLLFSKYMAFQQENVINAFIQRQELMSLVPPEYLAKGLDGLIVEDAGYDTQRLLGIFLADRYISRITDQDCEAIVRHAVRNNKKDSLTLLFQHDAIIRRLSTTFLKKLKRYVNQNEQTAIKRIMSERVPDSPFSGFKKSWNLYLDRSRIRPKKVTKSPFFSREDFQHQIEEMKDMVKEITKDGHALTPADQEVITRRLLEKHAPNLMIP